jgi:hypothetical protein
MLGSLPLYRHPTITVLIEGSHEAVDALWARLDPALMVHVAADPAAAQASIEISTEALHQLGDPIVLLDPDMVSAAAALDDRLHSIYRYIAGPQRFCAPAVVVVEYDAASRGMVACEEVSSVPGKKIWYTASSNSQEGIDAFNQRWIDRFVRNDQVESVSQLEKEIVVLQNEYFMDRSRQLGEVEADSDAYSFLFDPDFVALVDDLADRYGFVEHYLFCAPSGLLFFDADANPTLMAVHTEDSMVRQFELARDLSAPADLLQDIFECRVVPFCLEAIGAAPQADAGALERGCRPASVCRGRMDYYWALFDLPPAFRKAEPFSHARFMRDYSAVA